MEEPQPTPTLQGIERAAKMLTESLPHGLQLDGVAFVEDGAPQWSASYRVVGSFPLPEPANLQPARSAFQKSAPAHYNVKKVVVLCINIGGLLASKWQVTYGVGV